MCTYSLNLFITLANLLCHFRQSYISINDIEQHFVQGHVINGCIYLSYKNGFSIEETHAYLLLINYANRNGDTNNRDIQFNYLDEQHVTNLILFLMITSCLFSAKTQAESTTTDDYYLNKTVTHEQINDYLNISEDLDKAETEGELITSLINWINNNSSFDYKIDEIPYIYKVKKERMQQIAVKITIPASVNPDSGKIKGLYNFNSKTIYILDTFDIDDESDRGILLHELVHFLQFQHGDDVFFECKQQLESFAYRLQAKFLFGRDHPIHITGEHIRRASHCQ